MTLAGVHASAGPKPIRWHESQTSRPAFAFPFHRRTGDFELRGSHGSGSPAKRRFRAGRRGSRGGSRRRDPVRGRRGQRRWCFGRWSGRRVWRARRTLSVPRSYVNVSLRRVLILTLLSHYMPSTKLAHPPLQRFYALKERGCGGLAFGLLLNGQHRTLSKPTNAQFP